MKAHLLAPAGSSGTPEQPANAPDLIRDLALRPVLAAMADGDEFLLTTATDTLLRSLPGPETIRYRQQILIDCLENPAAVRRLYALTVEAIEGESKIYRGIFNNYPDAVLRRAIESLTFLMPLLRRLHALAETGAAGFQSPGFTRFFAMIAEELGPEYLETVNTHLKVLKFRAGVLLSAGLGPGNQAAGYTLRRSLTPPPWQNLRLLHGPPGLPRPVRPVLPDQRPRRRRIPGPVRGPACSGRPRARGGQRPGCRRHDTGHDDRGE